MKLPQGYTPIVPVSQQSNLVCQLQKSLYGLRQALRQCYSKFSSFLLSQGFTQSKVDYSLFIKGKGKNCVALLVYVDNIVLKCALLYHINVVK